MISRLKGRIEEVREHSIILSVDDLSYEILVPISILKTFVLKEEIELTTIHFYQLEGNRINPILIGFRNEIEKEFFTQLITVTGVGAKIAVRALKYPIPQIAIAIDRGDERFLSSLPGIGRQKARQIIAKLQGKVAKYALVREEEVKIAPVKPDIRDEALEILLQLQYKKKEAEEMIQKAMLRNPSLQNVEELLNEIYRVKISENGRKEDK